MAVSRKGDGGKRPLFWKLAFKMMRLHTRWFTTASALQAGTAAQLWVVGANNSVVELVFGSFWGAALVVLAALPDALYLCNWRTGRVRHMAWASTVHYWAWLSLESRAWWVEGILPGSLTLLLCVLLLATGIAKLLALLTTPGRRQGFPVWIFR